jgi:hypothetical protein
LYGFKKVDKVGNMRGVSSFADFEKYKRNIKMTPEEQRISYYNNYFIYQKVNDVNTDIVYNNFVNTGMDKNKLFEISKPKKIGKQITLIE